MTFEEAFYIKTAFSSANSNQDLNKIKEIPDTLFVDIGK